MLFKQYKNVVITGSHGFIGAKFAEQLLVSEVKRNIYLVDKFSKVSKPVSHFNNHELNDVRAANFYTLNANLAIPGAADAIWEAVKKATGEYPDLVVHFAAESHVDNSINSPAGTITNNVLSTTFVVEAVRKTGNTARVVIVGTDEVYGHKETVNEPGSAEDDKLDPRSPYSASKAASDLIALSYNKTYGTDVIVTRCCNNFGCGQYPEKLIPASINRAVNGEPIRIYGDGTNVREWIDVNEHVSAILLLTYFGKSGEIYNIGSGYRITNTEIARKVASSAFKKIDKNVSIEFVEDRKGHDKVYKLDCTKINDLLGVTSAMMEDTIHLTETRLSDVIEKETEYYLRRSETIPLQK